MAVERVIPEDKNKKEPIPEEIIIDSILVKFDKDGEFVVRGDGLAFYRKYRKYFDLMTTKYHLIYARTFNNLCLTEFGDTVCEHGSWSKYLDFEENKAKKEKSKNIELERIEFELKESTIKVNKLTLENSEQNKRIADLTEDNLKLQKRLNKWGLFRSYWWISVTLLAFIVQIVLNVLIPGEWVIPLLKQIIRLILPQQ